MTMMHWSAPSRSNSLPCGQYNNNNHYNSKNNNHSWIQELNQKEASPNDPVTATSQPGQQQQERQHLVEFEGRTLCISSPPKIACVLEAVYAALDMPKSVSESLQVPWRIMFGGRFLGVEDCAPAALSVLRVWTGGLKGGKGGFGAMLRAMAKQAGKKPTTDFGACRDLQGRRLRHVNDEIRLQKWQEDREKESRGEKVEETKTKSGTVENWHLGVPTWAEGAKPSYMKTRRKTVICQQWLDARKDRKAPDGAPPWWGCPRGRGCDFAHGKEELRGKGLEDFTKKQKLDTREKRQQDLDKYVEASSAEAVTATMSSAVEQGLRAAAKADARKAKEQADTAKELLGLDIQAGQASRRFSGCSWMEVAGGDMELTEEGQAQGASEFGTACVVGVALRKQKWYFEVKLLTAGLMQIGWADHTFVPGGPESGDGIGDVAGSWAYDGVRQQKWNECQRDYGEPWKVGDVVGCLLDIDAAGSTASMRYTLNGMDMGVAFRNVDLAPPAEPSTDALFKKEPGFFPAVSLEEGEAGIVNIGQDPFDYPPQEGFKAVISARTGGVDPPSRPYKQGAGGSGHGDVGDVDDEDGAERTPINLEDFDCATDLAERFGPNRLKRELEEKGVKCGGTHYQRAARLFSLKRLAPEDYPPEVLVPSKHKKAKHA